MIDRFAKLKNEIVKRNSIFIFAFFVIVLVVGIFNGAAFGLDIDQVSEEKILFMNLKPYAELILGADSEFTKKLGEEDVTISIERDHGAAPMYIAAPFCVSNTFRDNPHNFLIAYRACVFFISWLGLLSLYGVIKGLTNKKSLGILAVLIFWLSPRFFAECSYNNKDMVAAALILINIYFGYLFYYGKEKDYLSPVLLGVSVAFSVNARFVGIVIFGLIGMAYIVKLSIARRWSLRNLTRGLLAIISFIISYYLLTPAMWHGNAISFLRYVLIESSSFSRWDKFLMAAGQIYQPSKNPIEWWYSLAYMGVTIPPVFLILIVVGIVAVITRFFVDRNVESLEKSIFISVSLGYCLVILISTIMLKAVLYNGWRHLYSLYGPMIIMAITGIDYVLEKSTGQKKAGIIMYSAYGIIAVQLIFCLVFIFENHPNEFAYFNVFAGKNVEEKWDGDWWGMCSREILERLYEEKGVCSVSNYEAFYLVYSQIYSEEEIRNNIVVELFPDTDYIALNRMYVEYFLRSEELEWMDCDSSVVNLYKELLEKEPVFEIKSGNCLLWSVYEAP